MPSAKVKMITLLLILLGVFITSCEQHRYPISSDANRTLIASCDPDEMAKLNDMSLTLSDESAVCHQMVTLLQRQPPIFLLQQLFQLISAEKLTGHTGTPSAIAAQAMSIIQQNHEEADDEAIYDSFRSIDKTYKR